MSKNGSSSCRFCGRSKKAVTVPWTEETVRENCPPASHWGNFCGLVGFFYFSFFLGWGGRAHFEGSTPTPRPKQKPKPFKQTKGAADADASVSIHICICITPTPGFRGICLCKILWCSLVQFACITANMANSQMKPPVHMSVYISGHPSILCTTNDSTQRETDVCVWICL